MSQLHACVLRIAAPLILCSLLVSCGGGGGGSGSASNGGSSAGGGSPSTPSLPFAPPTVKDPNAPPPMAFNWSPSARAGDVIGVQGENFGNTPIVWLDAVGSTKVTELPVVNQVGTGWLAVQIPTGVTGALALRISNGSNNSARIALNAAMPMHLDTTRISPSGAFRIFGRNLLLPGSTPVVTAGGLTANVNLAASDEHMLTVTAPAGLSVGVSVAVTVDNGNGLGPATLPRQPTVAPGTGADPFGLGIGWTAAFDPQTKLLIDAGGDARLGSRMVCNGRTDDAPALREALVYAQRNGGGMVQMPAGVCVLGSSVQIFPQTILKGAGIDRTELQHTVDSPIFADRVDLYALRDFALTNVGATAGSSLNLKNGTRLVVQRVRVNSGAKALANIYGHTDVAVVDSEFTQSGSLNAPGALTLTSDVGLVFTGNRVRFLNNIGTNFDQVSDAYVQGNSWTRDVIRQSDPGVVHIVTINFARRIAMVGNSFDIVNGPADPSINHGETILTEGGGATRTESLGSVANAGLQTLTDPSARVNPNAYVNGTLPDNYGLAIVAGKGAGQTRRVTDFLAGTFTVDPPWDVVPDASSRYAAAVWGLESALIKANRLTGNSRGIMIYSTAARQVAIVGNSLSNSAGILVRSFQKVADGWFSPIVGVQVEGNTVANSNGSFPSFIAVNFANFDGQAVGTSHIGVEVRRNRLTANDPNIDATAFYGPEATEGYSNQLNTAAVAAATPLPRLLGTILQDNNCTNCATAIRLGTGAAGTVLWGTELVNSGTLFTDTATGNGAEKATATVVR